MTKRQYKGGCHCGAVRFAVEVDFEAQTLLACNCSICHKKGFVHLIVEPADFVLLRGEEALVSYRFNTEQAHHRFCGACGIHPFYTPRSHPDMVDVNVRCVEGVDWGALTIEPFDGRNWEDNVDAIQ